MAVGAVFFLPSVWFFGLCLAALEWAAWELVRLARPMATRAPLWMLLAVLPVVGTGICFGLPWATDPPLSREIVLALGFGLALVVAVANLLSRASMKEALFATGFLSFAISYLTLALVSLYRLREMGPGLLVLLLAMVWLGDTVAYYAGSRLGRHKMAPVTSPNKTWEGALAGLAAAVGLAVVGSLWLLGRVDAGLLAVSVAAAVAAPIGDLLESMLKRGVGVKDSGGVLPGHGGVLDRLDALLVAAPVFYLGLHLGGLTDLLAQGS